MDDRTENNADILAHITRVIQMIPGRVLVPEAIIKPLEQLEEVIKTQQKGPYNLVLLEKVHIALANFDRHMTEYDERQKIVKPDTTDLIAVVRFIEGELYKEFRPVTLHSVNDVKYILNDTPISNLQKSELISAMSLVYKAKRRHTRLNQLLTLRNVLAKHPYQAKLDGLRTSVERFLMLIMNVSNADELNRDLTLRSHLLKYKPDFVTMPPKKTPAGALLRDLLAFELADLEARPEHCNEIYGTAFEHWTGNRQQLLKRAKFGKPRWVYLTLLVNYTINAVAKGDINPPSAYDAEKDDSKNKQTYQLDQLNELESLRLYPHTEGKMFLQLQIKGRFNDTTWRFYPFNTHTMSINHYIPNRAMLVVSPDGEFFAAETTPDFVHSSLSSTAFFAGYIEANYGRWSEIGNYCGSFRTSEYSARLFFSYLYHDLGIYHPHTRPIFYIDHIHSKHDVLMAIEQHREELYKLLKQVPFEEDEQDAHINMEHSFYRMAAFKLCREAMNTLNYLFTKDNAAAIPRHKIPLGTLIRNPQLHTKLARLTKLNNTGINYLYKKESIERVITKLLAANDIQLSELYHVELIRSELNPNKFSYKIRRKSPLTACHNPQRSLFYYARKFESIMANTFERHFSESYRPNGDIGERMPTPEETQGLLNHTLFYRERMHQNTLNDRTIPKRKVRNYFSSNGSIDRAKTRHQRRLENLFKSRYFGILFSSFVYGTLGIIFYSLAFPIFSVGYVAAVTGACAILALTANVHIKERDISWGYFLNSALISIFFLVSILAIDIVPALAMPSLFITLSAPLVGMAIGILHYVLITILEHRIEKRTVDAEKYYASEEVVQRINQQGETLDETQRFFYNCQEARTQHKSPSYRQSARQVYAKQKARKRTKARQQLRRSPRPQPLTPNLPEQHDVRISSKA